MQAASSSEPPIERGVGMRPSRSLATAVPEAVESMPRVWRRVTHCCSCCVTGREPATRSDI
jgi:hypothetical protein